MSASGLTPMQERDAHFYDRVWAREARRDLLAPPDDELLTCDLGRTLLYVRERLGDLDGKRVLELGCGAGIETVMLARWGAQVMATDVSAEAAALTALRAAANGVADRVETRQMPAETLAFPDGVFDHVIGFSMLHHVDLDRVGPEVRRVLHTGGRALFREPLGHNRLLEFARRRLPYPAKERSPNEHPLTLGDIARVGRSFTVTTVRGFYLVSMLSRAMGKQESLDALWRLDEWLLRRWPALARGCRYAVIDFQV